MFLLSAALASPHPLSQATSPEAGPAAFLTWSRPGPVVPGLFEEAVPQGLAWLPTEQVWLVTHYREEQASLLSVLDADGQLRFVSELVEADGSPHEGHVGGVCATAERVWIGSSKSVWSASLDTALDGADALELTEHAVDSNASFVTCTAERVWVGEFARYVTLGRDYKTPSHHHHPGRDAERRYAWAFGHPVEGEGLAAEPDRRLSLPQEVQGMAFVGDTVVLSRSYGRKNESTIEVHGAPDGEREVFVDDRSLSFRVTAPPLAEGLAVHPAGLAVLFESAAAPYRKNALLQVDQVLVVDLEGLVRRGPSPPAMWRGPFPMEAASTAE